MPAKMIVNKSEIISVTKSAYYFFSKFNSTVYKCDHRGHKLEMKIMRLLDV